MHIINVKLIVSALLLYAAIYYAGLSLIAVVGLLQ